MNSKKDEILDKFPKYFIGKTKIEKFQGALLDLKVVLKVAEYFVNEIKRKTGDWNYEEAKIILFEMYNTVKTVRELTSKSNFDNSIKSYNTVSICSLTRSLIDGLVNINYLVQDNEHKIIDLKKEVWNYNVDRKRLFLVEKGGKISNRLHGLQERVYKKRKELSENKLLMEIKKGKDNAVKFLNSKEERIFPRENFLASYSNLYIDTFHTHLSQFIHFTPLGVNQSKKDNQNIDQLINFTAVIIQYNSIILSEVLMLLNSKYELKLENKFCELFKYYSTIFHNNALLINSNFKEGLNPKEEILLINSINDFLTFNKKKPMANRNSLFFFLTDFEFLLYNENLTKVFFKIRDLNDGIYYLVITLENKELLIMFRCYLKDGEVEKIEHVQNM